MPGSQTSPDLRHESMKIKYNALEPAISQEKMRLHHDKHHPAHVNGATAASEKLEKERAIGLRF